MRVGIGVRDPLLQRALGDLLGAEGHETATPELGLEGCTLQIVSANVNGDVPADCATLVLAHSPSTADDDPRAALEEALAKRGTCTWPPPLNVKLLVAVLGKDRPGSTTTRPPFATQTTPDLADAPHPWMLVEPTEALIVAANEVACAMLDLDTRSGACPLADVALPGALRDGLRERSEGIFPLENVDGGRWAVWWTDREGRRVVCLMHVPGENSGETRHQHLLAEIGRMTSTLAHEIRNPIASIAGAFELLETEDDPTDRSEILRMAGERLKQMSHLLEKTLLLARPIETSPETVDAGSLIESVVGTMRLDPRFEHIEIHARCPSTAIQIRAHPEPLQGALSNVMINAAQAQGGRGSIELTLETDSRRALIRVHDEGPGVPPDKREKIFRPFYTTKEAGTGLGLAEVRRAIEAAGGAISLEDVKSGACFCLELPLVRP